MRRVGLISTSALLAVLCAPVALASFQASIVPPFRGQPCTEYSGFETFTAPFGGTNSPDDPATTSPDTRLEQLVAGAIITGAGNIDHLSQAPVYRLTDAVPGDLQEVALQVSIHLNQFPWANVVLRYTDANQVVQSVAPTTSSHLVFLMGHEERLVTWDLSANPDTILSYSIEMPAAFASTTLDAIQLDTRFACSPGVVFCAGDGTGGACPCANGAPGARVIGR
jgi:hypothetical protein